MITEDYVSFEIAKLLRDKGFEQDTVSYPYYTDNGNLFTGDMNTPTQRYYNAASAPTLQMAMKWLREVHHYYIQVMLDSLAIGYHTGYYVVIQKTDSDFEMMLQDAVDEVFYQTYEEACEAAIKYTLENLI